jgi:hypothetical protein
MRLRERLRENVRGPDSTATPLDRNRTLIARPLRVFRVLTATIASFSAVLIFAQPASGIAFPDREASASEKSYTVPVLVRDGAGFRQWCTGALISSTLVATAAHCVYKQSHTSLLVGSPGSTLDELKAGRAEIREVVFYGYHSNYLNSSSSRFGTNDVATLVIGRPFTLFTTLAIPSPAVEKRAIADDLHILGYGTDQNGDDRGRLMFGTVADLSSVGSKYSDSFNPTTQIAAGSFRPEQRVFVGSCSGDSGGPLVGRVNGIDLMIGITSYGAADCATSSPSFYMRTSYYSKFFLAVEWYREQMTNISMRSRTVSDPYCDTIVSSWRMVQCLDAALSSATVTATPDGLVFSHNANPRVESNRTDYVELDENGDGSVEYLVTRKGVMTADMNMLCPGGPGLTLPRSCLNNDTFKATIVVSDARTDTDWTACSIARAGGYGSTDCPTVQSTATDWVDFGLVFVPQATEITSPRLIQEDSSAVLPQPLGEHCIRWRGDSIDAHCGSGKSFEFSFCHNAQTRVSVESYVSGRWVPRGRTTIARDTRSCSDRKPYVHTVSGPAPKSGAVTWRVRVRKGPGVSEATYTFVVRTVSR